VRQLRVAIVAPGFVIDRDDPGLAAVFDLVERIAAVHDCQVVALRYPPARPPYVVAGATVRALGAGSSGGAFGRAAVLARGIRAVLAIHREEPVDLVHALWADEAGAVATIASRLIRRPVIVSVLGGELARLPEIGYGGALGRGGRWTVGISLPIADLVTVGSSVARESVLPRRRKAGIALLPLGVDVSVFRPAEGRRATPTILFVGSLEPVKDPATMLRVFAALAATRPRLRLDVAGEGSLRPSLERMSEELGIRDRVRLLGQLPRAQMPDLYRSSSVLAVTSLHEGQSMAAVEAAASGSPVVGTRVGVLPDLGGGALTVPVGDEAGLVTALAAVLDDGALAARTGAAGRAQAVARFDLDRTAGDLLERYGALASAD
jgi:glycosyltransferase involved in cell wall biosynthesis